MRILVFGDSITQGFHDDQMGGWCNRLIAEVMRQEIESDYEYNRSVVNLGISGDTSADVLKRVRVECEARLNKYPTDSYDVLVLAIGVNDAQFEMASGKNKIPVEVTLKNVEKIISDTKEFFGEVVLVGLAPVYDKRVQPMAWKPTHGYSNEVIKIYNDALRLFARENSYHFINMSDVYFDTEASLPDGIHPNAEGHRFIYERVKSELEKVNIL